MGGIIVGTVLTLLFLPALYVSWFRIKAPDRSVKVAHKVTANQLEAQPA